MRSYIRKMIPTGYLTQEEALAYAGVSDAAFRSALQRGSGPPRLEWKAIQSSGTHYNLYTKADLDAWMLARKAAK